MDGKNAVMVDDRATVGEQDFRGWKGRTISCNVIRNWLFWMERGREELIDSKMVEKEKREIGIHSWISENSL